MPALRVLAIGFAFIFSGGAVLCHSAASERQPFAPLAAISVSLHELEAGDFMEIVAEFAKAHHLTIESGGFPKRGRTVVNLRIPVSDQTFFTVNNFRDANTYELIAYSHEGAEIWQNLWDTLVSALSSKFGLGRVTPIKPH